MPKYVTEFWWGDTIRAIYWWKRGYGTFWGDVFWSGFCFMWFILWIIIVVFLILATAVFTLYERDTISDLQFRKGPSKVGYFGTLQPIADALKLILKQNLIPRFARMTLFQKASWVSFFAALALYHVVPIWIDVATFNDVYSFLWLLNFSIVHLYSIMLAGWASTSKYAFLGCLRTSAQMISYDITLSMVFLSLFACFKVLDFSSFIELQSVNKFSVFLYTPVVAIILFITALAEGNRHPYDLPEAEAELVSGYNVEYSSILFAMFFLGEYLSVLVSAIAIDSLIFEQYSLLAHITRVIIIVFCIIHVRAMLPRFRYDQLMSNNWKFLIPVSSGFIYFITYSQKYSVVDLIT